MLLPVWQGPRKKATGCPAGLKEAAIAQSDESISTNRGIAESIVITVELTISFFRFLKASNWL